MTNIQPDYTILFTNYTEYNNGISNCIGLCIENEVKYCIYSEYNNKFFLIKDKFEELIDDPKDIFNAMDAINNLVKFSKIFGQELHTPGSHESCRKCNGNLSECIEKLADNKESLSKAKVKSIIIEDKSNTSYEIACSSKLINNLNYHEYCRTKKKLVKIVDETPNKSTHKSQKNTLLHRFLSGRKS